MNADVVDLKLSQPAADSYVPDGLSMPCALARTSHLGIAAHPDDLEFMALDGILACHNSPKRWFGGIICTNGSGCPRTGDFAAKTDLEMVAIRAEEQREAARIGQYAFVSQLGFQSTDLKDQDKRCEWIGDLEQLLNATRPDVVYMHNLADRHPTHVAVALAVIEAIRWLPTQQRPGMLIGCEVWRDLDWLPDERKVVMDVSRGMELGDQLAAVFQSQLQGGKRYDRAVAGRRFANATFLNSHKVDHAQAVAFGMDLTPLIEDDALSPRDYLLEQLSAFKAEITSLLPA